MSVKNKEGFAAKCFYGFADIYGGGAFVVISTFYTVFLTKALVIPAVLAGTIPLVGKIWDAVTDPVMGNIADRTSSRFGAKRFYLLLGSIVSAITFLLMWLPFSGGSITARYFFYLGMYMLFSTGFTIVMVPYNALLPDMVDDYTARSKFSGVRMVFSTFGAILAGLVPTICIRNTTSASEYLPVALFFSLLFFAAIFLTFWGTWEKQKQPVRVSIRQSFVQCFTVYKSRSFRLFIIIFLAGQGAADFGTGMAVYYVDDVLNAYGGGRFTMLMGTLLLAGFLGTILFSLLMPRTSKRFPILIGFPVRILATLALLFFSHEGSSFAAILFLTFVNGLGTAASSTSIYAILSDMADVDELITSINRPALCSAMATFIRKIATGFSASIIGILLALVGFDEQLASTGLRQSAHTQAGIAYIYVFVPVILLVLTILAAVFFPLNRREFEIVKKEIARRKGRDTSPTPAEEIKVIEKVTGFAFGALWNENNALKLWVKKEEEA